jgi:hypothetical protein
LCRANKKTLRHRVAACGPALPANAIQVYDDLRAAVLHGHADPRAMAAIAFHGLWRGLAVLAAGGGVARQPPAHAAPSTAPPIAGTHDCQLVRQLANMVLAVQSQVQHAY